jgi:hypothetical protein
MTWREEEQGQKGAFHKHWQENARGYKTFPFAHQQLKPITIDILPPPPLLLTSSMGGGQERGGLPLCGEMDLQAASAEGALHIATRQWQPYACDLKAGMPITSASAATTTTTTNTATTSGSGSGSAPSQLFDWGSASLRRKRKVLLVGDSVMYSYFKSLKSAITQCKQLTDSKVVQGADPRYGGFLGSSRHAGEHWICKDGVELWYHQLGRVDPPLPKPSAAGAADYLAKERYHHHRYNHNYDYDGHNNNNNNNNNLVHQRPDSGSVSGRGGGGGGSGGGRGSGGSGLYQNKEFMRYVKMDVLDFSYLYDVGPLDAVIYNAAIHAYTFDPHVYARMLEYTMPILELAAGGEPSQLWYVTSGHVSGKKHPHNSKPYMHELQNDVRFSVFDDIARELCALRGWSVLEAYGMSVVGKAKDALHLDLDDAGLIRQFLAHYVLLQ